MWIVSCSMRVSRRLIQPFGADEAPAAPAALVDHVGEGLTVVEEGVAQKEQFTDRRAHAAHLLDAVDKPDGGFGVVAILFARNLLAAQFHVVERVLETGHTLVERLQVAVDYPVVTDVRQRRPPKVFVHGLSLILQRSTCRW
jgi:hypothetical protein